MSNFNLDRNSFGDDTSNGRNRRNRRQTVEIEEIDVIE